MKPIEVTRGFRFNDHIGEIRVMIVQDGYAMVRRPGAMPFVKSVKEILRQIEQGTD